MGRRMGVAEGMVHAILVRSDGETVMNRRRAQINAARSDRFRRRLVWAQGERSHGARRTADRFCAIQFSGKSKVNFHVVTGEYVDNHDPARSPHYHPNWRMHR